MGQLSPIVPPATITLEIPVRSHFLDHRFEGQAVLPAVESMALLARMVATRWPDCQTHVLKDAQFDKFLNLPKETPAISATAELTVSSNEDIEASLVTRTRAPKAAITRARTHARIRFCQTNPKPPPLLLDILAVPEGVCHRIPAHQIYQELVPFGPSYQNIQGDLLLSTDGALARIVCPDIAPAGDSASLGSPFALDAAFHAACVWGQRFVGVVGFPTAVADRRIFRPAKPGEACFARVLPKQISRQRLCYDILLVTPDGRLMESVRGVEMRDPSGGRLTPPAGIMDQMACRKTPSDPLENLQKGCRLLTIVELEAPAPFGSAILSPLERDRFIRMGSRRKKSFLAARLALKRMYRKWEKVPSQIPALEIETTVPNDPRPRCRILGKPAPTHVSVSHDARFAVAVGHDAPVGVDVETIAPRCLRVGRLFMSEKESALCQATPMDATAAAVRIWSVKEAVSKALNLPLEKAWRQIEVCAVDQSESQLTIQGRPAPPARHTEVSGHLFTLFLLSSPADR